MTVKKWFEQAHSPSAQVIFGPAAWDGVQAGHKNAWLFYEPGVPLQESDKFIELFEDFQDDSIGMWKQAWALSAMITIIHEETRDRRARRDASQTSGRDWSFLNDETETEADEPVPTWDLRGFRFEKVVDIPPGNDLL